MPVMSGRMGTSAPVAEATIGRLRPAAGLSLLGEDPSSGSAGSRFLVRRADRQVIQLSQLPYLVTVAIAETAAAGNNSRAEADGADPVLVAARVSRDSGQQVTAADVRSLVTGELAPLGVVTAGAPDSTPDVPTGAARKKAPRPRRRTVVLGAAAALAAVAGATLAIVVITRPGSAPTKTTASEVQAAAWVARQVSSGTMVSCDPATCGLLRRDGFPASRLMALEPATPDPLGSEVVVATSAVRSEFGARLATVFAPLVLAGFGSGNNRVEVRAIAPDGAEAYRAALEAQHASLASAGQQLLVNQTVQASPAARAALLGGRVDPRLLAVLSVLSSQQTVRLETFGAAPPGGSSAVPLRAVELGAGSAAARSAIMSFLDAQRGAYRPDMMAATRGSGGQPAVTVRFDAPDLLSTP
jgi:hypothetical protein